MKKILIGIVLVICGILIGFDFTMKNLEIGEINEKDQVITMTIFNQVWVYEK